MPKFLFVIFLLGIAPTFADETSGEVVCWKIRRIVSDGVRYWTNSDRDIPSLKQLLYKKGELAPEKMKGRVLDIGMGEGAVLVANLSEANPALEVYGVDIVKRPAGKADSPNLKYETDIRKTGFPDGFFNHQISHAAVFSHKASKEKIADCLKEMSRISADQGQILLGWVLAENVKHIEQVIAENPQLKLRITSQYEKNWGMQPASILFLEKSE